GRPLGCRAVVAATNGGFAAAANELIRLTTGAFLLLLNPDAYPAPDYLARLTEVMASDPRIGSATGKLVRMPAGDTPARIDSAGHVFYRNRAALNRGENEPDRGQADQPGDGFRVLAPPPL